MKSAFRFALLTSLFSAAACVSPSSDRYAAPLRGTIAYAQSAPGITIETAGPARVSAAMTGRVIDVTRATDGTKTLVMDHGGGVRTEYAQLSRLTAARGEDIRRGSTIGWIGERGEDAAELRFAMRVGNAPIDPMQAVDFGRAAPGADR